jgi:hypothetical protein
VGKPSDLSCNLFPTMASNRASMRCLGYLCLVLICCLGGTGLLRAQDDEQQKPEEEIPDFSNIDEYIYVPKTTLNYGFRYYTGVKATFKGNGSIPAPSTDSIGDSTTPDVLRTYHDGSVGVDARTIATDNGNGTTTQAPVNGSDGKTNTWSYDSANQVTPDGLMTFSSYSAQTTDTLSHSNTGKSAFGTEISAVRDMGDFGKRFSWKLFAGFSVNVIDADMTGNVTGTVTATTDTYDLFGQAPPPAPYTAPTPISPGEVDSTGITVTDINGNAQSQTGDNSTLIGDVPLTRNTTTTPTIISNHWQVRGSYLTLRAGPSLIWNISPRLHLSLSAGPALVYAGSDYQVTEIFTPNTGPAMSDALSDVTSKVLFGYYGDATLEYDITDRTGLYIGSYYQDSGKYDQTISTQTVNNVSVNANYTTRVDMSDQSGVRTGLTYKF